MEPLAKGTGIAELLAHEGWLRRLVVELVDERHVEDVLQETWAAALARGPARIVHPRAWLRRVARNQALRLWRTDARRARRESAAVVDGETPSTADMVERLQAHQRVARAVADLDEPYRTVILLRFFEDLPPREIARRLGLPGSTVRTRIERGLQKVRGRLEGADVRALALLILAPRLGEPVVPAATAWSGAALLTVELAAMTVRHKSLTVVSLLLFSGLGAWLASAPSVRPPSPAPQATRLHGAAGPTEAAPRIETARDPVPGVVPAAAVTAPELRGRVVDPTGQPLAGVPLAFLPAPTDVEVVDAAGRRPIADEGRLVALGAAGADGSFALACPHAFGELFATGDYVTVRTFTPPRAERNSKEALVIAAPVAGVRGQVVDPGGRGLAGVSVEARVDGLTSIDVPLEHTSVVGQPRTVTDADGGFEIGRLPLLPELVLRFAKRGHRAVERYDVFGSNLHIVLSPAKPGVRVSGTVVDTAGLGIPRAMVLLGENQAMTGAHGEFSVSAEELGDDPLFGAAFSGLQATARPDVVRRLRELVAHGEGGEIDGIVVRLGPPALSLHGRVLDVRGEPLAGVVVTNLGARAVSAFHTVEDFVAGCRSEIDNPARGVPAKIDARTAADGSFAVRGLSDRDYELLFFDPDTLASTTAVTRAGGRGLDVRLDTSTRRKVRGIVRSRRGDPLAGIRVTWGLTTFRTPGDTFSLFATGGTVRTDEHGGFAVDGIPAGDIELNVAGDDIVAKTVSLRGVRDGGAVDVVCARRCRIRVEIGDPAATRIRVLGADGQVLQLRRSRGRVSTVGDGWNLARGRTPVLEVSEEATTLVVLGDGRELARYAIAPVPGDVEVIRR